MSIKILSPEDIEKTANTFNHPPLLFANPKNLYQRRIKRLKQLAKNHPFADYLDFVANIVTAQLTLLEQIPVPKDSQCLNHTHTPLHIKQWKRHPIWQEILTALLAQIKPTASETVLTTIDWLEKAAESELESLADQLLAQEFSTISSDKAIFIWAALSLYWLQLTQHLPKTAQMESAEDLHLCPVCQSAPTASVIHFGAEQGLRYLHCSLCESEWYLVRSKCSNCDQTGKLDYWSIDQEFAPVRAESCGDCHSYLKAMYQEKDPHVEPIADDLASIFLDIELEEKGFSRSGVNPFLFSQE